MRITIKEASEMLGISEQAVRTQMRKKQIDIGYVGGTKQRATYIIFDEKVRKLKGEG